MCTKSVRFKRYFSIHYVIASTGTILDYIPLWTIGGYTIMINAISVVLQILILRRNFEWVVTIPGDGNSIAIQQVLAGQDCLLLNSV